MKKKNNSKKEKVFSGLLKDVGSYIKKNYLFLILFVAATASIFAQSTATAEMNNIVGNLVSFFENGWVKGIACIALIAEAIGLIFAGGQNPQIFKKFLPLIAGTVIFMCAGKIITLVFGANETQNFKQDLNLGMVVPIERSYTDMC